MLRRQTVCASLIALLCASSVYAQDLEEMEQPTAAAYGQFLAEQLMKQDDLKHKLDLDIQNAVGLVREASGIIAVPVKGLTAESNPATETETGAPFAYIFFSPQFHPVVKKEDGEESKLRTVEIMGPDGSSVNAAALVLSARHVEGEEWRLYGFGTGDKPVVDAQFFQAEEEKPKPISLHVQDAADEKATLVVTLHGLYEASFPINLKSE